MRLFVAVQPPPAAVAELAEAVSWLRRLPGAEQLRWTEVQGWHLTLAFLGEVEEEQLPELGRRLERAAGRHEAPRVRLAGGGRFGDRALWAAVPDGSRALGRISGSVGAAARRSGIDVEEGGFRAHLTLARSRHPPVDLRPYQRALAPFEGRSWTADLVRLMRSTPGDVGHPPHYDTVESWPMRGA